MLRIVLGNPDKAAAATRAGVGVLAMLVCDWKVVDLLADDGLVVEIRDVRPEGRQEDRCLTRATSSSSARSTRSPSAYATASDPGDLTALMQSIEEVGLLQPITVTPDGVLVCGWRRLEAMRRLGKRTLSVWVRSGISDQLSHLLAQQDENEQRKPLSPVETARLYARDQGPREGGRAAATWQPRSSAAQARDGEATGSR